MGQMEFFDISNRYAALDVRNDPPAKIDAVIAWQDLRARNRNSLSKMGNLGCPGLLVSYRHHRVQKQNPKTEHPKVPFKTSMTSGTASTQDELARIVREVMVRH